MSVEKKIIWDGFKSLVILGVRIFNSKILKGRTALLFLYKFKVLHRWILFLSKRCKILRFFYVGGASAHSQCFFLSIYVRENKSNACNRIFTFF